MTKKYIGGIYATVGEWQERKPADFYPTEQNAIDAYLHLLHPIFSQHTDPNGNPVYPSKVYIADLGAGDGRWGLSTKKVIEKYYTVDLFGADIRDIPKPIGYDRWYHGDVLDTSVHIPRADIIIGNPPYSHAEQFLDLALESVNTVFGVVSFLLPITFLAGLNRFKHYYNNGREISRIVVYNTRPSFSGDGKTYPGREYAQFEWWYIDGLLLNSEDFGNMFGSPIRHIIYDR